MIDQENHVSGLRFFKMDHVTLIMLILLSGSRMSE